MAAGLFKAPTSNFLTTSLNGAINASVQTITLTSTSGMQSPGYIIVDRTDANGVKTPNSREVIKYTGISGSDLTGCTRGADNSTARAHSDQAIVETAPTIGMWNDLVDWGSAEHKTDGTHVMSTASAATMHMQKAFASTASIGIGTFNQVIVGTYINASGASVVGFSSSTGINDWVDAGETWTYAGADDPTFTFTIAGVDKTTKYYPGMRVKLTQTSVKYFIITKVAFSTDTTIIIYGGTDYDLANAAITSPQYSTHKIPTGFPGDPNKWTVEVSDTTSRTQSSPVGGTWYNLGAVAITVPVGVWDTEFHVSPGVFKDASTVWNRVLTTLSTATSTQSDVDFTTHSAFIASSSANYGQSAPASKRKVLSLTTKTPYYLNTQCETTSTTLYNNNDLEKLFIRATCAYL